MPMSYKTTNDLMQHLRDNGIAISGETQKQQLVTTGYYHGYKGYRFFKSAGARLPFPLIKSSMPPSNMILL